MPIKIIIFNKKGLKNSNQTRATHGFYT